MNADRLPLQPKMAPEMKKPTAQKISQKNTSKRYLPPENPALRQKEDKPADLRGSIIYHPQSHFKLTGYKTKLQGFWVDRHQVKSQKGRSLTFRTEEKTEQKNVQ